MNTLSLLSSLVDPTDEERKRIAWCNATEIPGRMPEVVRIDCDGRLMFWSEYGKLSEFGWEIDHAHPKGLGGLDVWGNLRARHWYGNRSAGAGVRNALLP